MSNSFFIASKCDRCGRDLTVRVMFRFNTDTLCPKCEQKERLHPDYLMAAAAELGAIRRGDLNFHGIGWLGKSGRVK